MPERAFLPISRTALEEVAEVPYVALDRNPISVASMCPSSPDDLGSVIRTRLNRALSRALKSRDATSVSALRSALAAIGNAEAPDSGTVSLATTSSPDFAGTATGLGAGETPRRRLSGAQVDQIVRTEISERQAAAREYEQAGHPDQADRLRDEAQALLMALPGEHRAGA